MTLTGFIRTARHRTSDRSGAAAVEFALVLPLLVLILFGIVEFAAAWHARQLITNAAREGARVAVVGNAMMPVATLVEEVQQAVERAAGSMIDLSNLTVTMEGVGVATSETAAVTLEYVYTPLVGLVLRAPITLSTTSVMRNE
jgi:Flp pilus assembly protein TadG